MSTESPQFGEVSADGQFRWDGTAWAPLARGYREPTSWTLPLRRTAGIFLVAYALAQVVAQALFITPAALERTLRASNTQLTEDQVRMGASLGYSLGWATVVVIALAALLLAAGSLQGWRWTFWADLAAFALMSIGVISNLLALVSSSVQALPPAAIAANLLISLVALALLVWLIVAATRYGPWAMRRPGA